MTRPDAPGRRTAAATRRLSTILFLLATALIACTPGEEPVPAALRDRLRSEARLGPQELDQVRAAVSQRIAGRAVQVTEGEDVRTLDDSQRALLFDVLTLPAGVFDEGIRREGTQVFRLLNGPARSDNTEIETFQRLWIDADTLLPRKYEFAYAFPGYGQDRTYELSFGRRGP